MNRLGFSTTSVLVALTLGVVACGGSPSIDGTENGAGGEAPAAGGSTTDIDVGQGGARPEPEPEPETPWTCGDGTLEPGELCDDGNTQSGDGCSADCQSQNPNFDCSQEGEPCINLVVCGNGTLEGDEACDDGDEDGGDGCAADCSAVEDGFSCGKPGTNCVRVPQCGNGIRERGEECDSGPVSDPGCVDCTAQAGYFCIVPGQACLEDDCGNGILTPNEECDDGKNVSGDGCSPTCKAEAGFRCTVSGCNAICGNGTVEGDETCDDGDLQSGDGCSAGCRNEPGFTCPALGGACSGATCGNSSAEPGEGCDDGNTVAGDGCGPTCQLEPVFIDGQAQTACGDGLITGAEQCDDGNLTSGDGCDDSCETEPGFVCSEFNSFPEQVELQVTYRDFKARGASGGHPDFEWKSSPFKRDMPGPVCTATNNEQCSAPAGSVCSSGCGWLDDDGKPEFHLADGEGTVTNPETYALWYRDGNPDDVTGKNGVVQTQSFTETLVLDRIGGDDSDVYEFDSNGDSFYPLTGSGFGESCGEVSPECCDSGGKCLGRNYHFTTELRYFFQYEGGETLTFRGDDDVWVFVNGRHAVDIGGVHGARWGRVVLGDDGAGGAATDSDCSAHGTGEPEDCSLEPAEQNDDTDERFGLTTGGVYEIVLFHAERHTTSSNFKLTLAGFLAPRSSCVPDCGDGQVVGWEVCDDGDDNQDGVYGVCNTTCTAKQFCGDGIRQSSESCDNGFNLSLYDDGGANLCAPGCVAPPYCGDGSVDPIAEDCDAGTAANDGAYGGCEADCTWGPYCGDGQLDAPDEACDDGLDGNVAYAASPGECGYDCAPAPYCGDGERNGPEQCDDGAEGNDGEYGGCNDDCTRAPYCGDGQLQADQGEQCDAGPTGSLSCSTTCRRRITVTK